MSIDEKKRQWLNNLPEEIRLNSVYKVEALSNEDTRNKIYFGNRQSGKTHMLMLDMIYYAKENAGCRIGVITSTISAKRYIFTKTKDMLISFMRDDIKHGTTNPHFIRLNNDSSIYFFSNEQDMRGHRLDCAYFDDLHTVSQRLFERTAAATLEKRSSFIIGAQLPGVNTDMAKSILRGNN